MESKFTTPKTGWPLWEHLIDAHSKQDANAWKSLKKFIGESKSILFFDPSDEEGAFLIKKLEK